MKPVCAVLLCCLAVALANRTPEDDDLIDKHLEECRNELNVPDPATLPRDTVVPKSEKSSFSCMMFCMQKKKGMFYEDGTINKEAIFAANANSSSDEKEAIRKAIENCEKTVKPVDGCKMAACLMPTGPTRAV